MLTRRSMAAVVVAAAVLLALVPVTGAQAQPDCGFRHHTDANGDEHLVWTCGEGWSGGGGGDGEWVCTTNLRGREVRVPCIDPVMGWFTTSHGGCYIRPAVPQPPADDPAWQGNDPSDGLVYTAWCFVVDGVDGMPYVQLSTMLFFPAGEGVVGDLVEQAIALLPLRGPDIHLAPDPDGAGLVGLPVWMWTPATESTWGPATASLSALGVTVSVAANAEHITWAMGDGTQVQCDEPGTPYQPEFGAEPASCGHVYERPSRTEPDGRFPVTATTQWRIEWRIEETVIAGTVPTSRESSASVRINELQVVTS
ncbi:MAG: hypothetical protein GEV12_09995 [Micromonosporaceae bacterium]|nr:hypothetical protein [Micromonosporaceae bacterium]